MKILHVVAAFQILNDVATTRGAKRFNRVEFAFLHTCCVPTCARWPDIVRAK